MTKAMDEALFAAFMAHDEIERHPPARSKGLSVSAAKGPSLKGHVNAPTRDDTEFLDNRSYSIGNVLQGAD